MARPADQLLRRTHMAADHPRCHRLSAGYASLPVELNAAWTAEGPALAHREGNRRGRRRRAAAGPDCVSEIEDLRQRITDATRRIAEPFPHAAELEAARSRRDAIDAENPGRCYS